MNWNFRNIWTVYFMLVVAGLLAVTGAAQQETAVVVRDEIFGTQAAAELVGEAREYDPMYCKRGKEDRGRAASLYERAILAQPGAAINAALAERVAQMYAFYEDRSKNVRPDQTKARVWWQKCLELSDPKQLLWAQAQIGLGCSSFMTKDTHAAVAAFRAVLDVNMDEVELPKWKTWPDGDTERKKQLLEEEKDRLRKSVERVKKLAVDKVFYVASHADPNAGIPALQEIVTQYKGSPVGERASELLVKALTGRTDTVYEVRKWTFDDKGVEMNVQGGGGQTPATQRAATLPARDISVREMQTAKVQMAGQGGRWLSMRSIALGLVCMFMIIGLGFLVRRVRSGQRG